MRDGVLRQGQLHMESEEKRDKEYDYEKRDEKR